MADDPDFYAPLPKYVPGGRTRRRRPSPRIVVTTGLAAMGIVGAAAAVVAITGSGSGSAHAGTTPSAPRSTSAYQRQPSAPTAAPAAPDGTAAAPLIAATYLVNRDILPGHYRAQNTDPSCSWAVTDENGALDIERASGKPITIVITGTDKSLQVEGDCLFIRIGR